MEEKNYKKEANPTYFTAKGTLLKLAEAKNEDALEYMKLIDMSDLSMGITESGDAFSTLPKEIAEKVGKSIGCAIELRYNVISKMLSDSKFKNFFDIACGYTPRGLYCKRNNIDYIGVDVPIVVDEMNEKVGEITKNSKHAPYIAVDATNPITIIKAAENLNGEIFISCEGLIMYLTFDEIQELISGIKEILAKNGGAWYTCDLGVDYAKVAGGFITDENIRKKLAENATTLKKSNDIQYFANNFKTEEEKIKFFESKGLKVEKYYIKDMDIKISQLENESDEIKENVKKIFDTFYCCKITLKDEEKNKMKNNYDTVSTVEIEHNIVNGDLKLKISGRLDTLTSPELLEVYDIESEKGDISNIEIDATSLEYISSAGLRVILKTYKTLKGGTIKIIEASDLVKDIFKTTGFDKFIIIC